MEKGNIGAVISGFKKVITNIPSQYDNFDDALDKFFEAFYLTMDEMLPMKYFALYEDSNGYVIAIFDNEKDCEEWITEGSGLAINESVTCNKISVSKFIELAYDEWANPNCYDIDSEELLTFKL